MWGKTGKSVNSKNWKISSDFGDVLRIPKFVLAAGLGPARKVVCLATLKVSRNSVEPTRRFSGGCVAVRDALWVEIRFPWEFRFLSEFGRLRPLPEAQMLTRRRPNLQI